MPTDIILKVLIWAVPVLFSIVIHEVAHGWMANKLGDDTAKRMGRLTLNPISHIDPLGTIILPLIMIIMGGGIFGWAKPVPFNPSNFRRNIDPKTGAMWVAAAGPGSNLILAFITTFVFVAIQKFFPHNPPIAILQLASALIQINIWLALLNLIPIPPLDGSKILFRFLPPAYETPFLQIERYGFFILILFMFAGGFKIISVPMKLILNLFFSIAEALLSIF
jgi:Zn-dependent protease